MRRRGCLAAGVLGRSAPQHIRAGVRAENLKADVFYVGHPIVPLAGTLADLNLKVIGRTDDTEGPTPHQINVTGYDYTGLAPTIERAGLATGTKIFRHPVNSDRFFARGDNISFAEAGVPSVSLSAAYEYPDLHTPNDKWPKLDYAKPEQLDRCIALALGTSRIATRSRAGIETLPKPRASSMSSTG